MTLNVGRGGRESGYSLVELLVSVFVMTVLMTGMYSAMFQSQATFDAQQDAMALRQQARVAMDEMATQLRMAGAGMDNLPEPLVQGSATSVVIVADIDAGSATPPCGAASENAIDGGAERLSFRIVNGELLRSIDCWDGNSWSVEYANQVLARDLVGASGFRYFDTNGVELLPGAGNLTAAQREQVRVIGVAIALQDAEVHVVPDSLVDYDMATLVQLRNLFD